MCGVELVERHFRDADGSRFAGGHHLAHRANGLLDWDIRVRAVELPQIDRVDAETSDYYMLGYYSSNADQSRRRRKIEIKITRPGVEVRHRTEYTLKPRSR